MLGEWKSFCSTFNERRFIRTPAHPSTLERNSYNFTRHIETHFTTRIMLWNNLRGPQPPPRNNTADDAVNLDSPQSYVLYKSLFNCIIEIIHEIKFVDSP